MLPPRRQEKKSKRKPPRRYIKVPPQTRPQNTEFVPKVRTKLNLNIFVTTQMRTGSTWICDLLSGMFNRPWQFWSRGRDIGAERFKKHITNPIGINIFKMHYTPPKRICECIPEGDKNNFVVSVTRDVRDVAVSKIMYMRYDSAVRNLTRLQSINKARLKFNREALKDKEYINEFIKTPSFRHIIKNWKMYNDGFTHPNYLLISYDELNARPAFQLSKIYEFLGVPIPIPQAIRQVVVNNNFQHKAGRKKGEERNSAFRRKGISGDYQNYLNQESLDIITNLLGDNIEVEEEDEDNP